MEMVKCCTYYATNVFSHYKFLTQLLPCKWGSGYIAWIRELIHHQFSLLSTSSPSGGRIGLPTAASSACRSRSWTSLSTAPRTASAWTPSHVDPTQTQPCPWLGRPWRRPLDRRPHRTWRWWHWHSQRYVGTSGRVPPRLAGGSAAPGPSCSWRALAWCAPRSPDAEPSLSVRRHLYTDVQHLFITCQSCQYIWWYGASVMVQRNMPVLVSSTYNMEWNPPHEICDSSSFTFLKGCLGYSHLPFLSSTTHF